MESRPALPIAVGVAVLGAARLAAAAGSRPPPGYTSGFAAGSDFGGVGTAPPRALNKGPPVPPATGAVASGECPAHRLRAQAELHQ